MANNMMLFPWPSDPALPHHDDLLSFFREGGLSDPGPARAATQDELNQVLLDLGWPFDAHQGDDYWRAFYAERLPDGTWPPIQEVSRHDDGTLGFRLGPTYGPWAVSAGVARCAGPHVAFEASGSGMCIVTGDLTYERFCRELFESDPESPA